jgi:hypothetical protein
MELPLSLSSSAILPQTETGVNKERSIERIIDYFKVYFKFSLKFQEKITIRFIRVKVGENKNFLQGDDLA